MEKLCKLKSNKYFYSYLDELVEAGRLKNLRNIKEARGKNRAEEMLRSGIGKHVIWKTEDICLVPSESSDTSYNVHIIKATCECASSTQGGNYERVSIVKLSNHSAIASPMYE